MTHAASMKFEVDRDNRVIHVNRAFDAPLDLVWDAWTKAEILDQWWAPKPWKAVTKEQDFKNGGFWHYYMLSPDGKDKHWCSFDYENIETQKYYKGIDAFCDENRKINATKPRARWDVNFTPQEGSTMVSMVIGFEREEDVDAIIQMGFKEGFTMGMGNLDELLPKLK